MTKRPNYVERERFSITFDHPEVTATTTWKMWKVPTGKKFLVERASYINVTGLAEDATHAFKGEVKNGSTVVATLFNTDSDGAGDNNLTADTFFEGTLSATAADKWLDAADILSLVATEGVGATATLPAGRVIVEGYLY